MAESVYVARNDDGEISHAAARAIAAAWQSPAAVGATLAAFASGRPVMVDALHDDVWRSTRGWRDVRGNARIALECLCTYAMAHATEPNN